jgi:hypothetical protein
MLPAATTARKASVGLANTAILNRFEVSMNVFLLLSDVVSDIWYAEDRRARCGTPREIAHSDSKHLGRSLVISAASFKTPSCVPMAVCAFQTGERLRHFVIRRSKGVSHSTMEGL